MNNQFPGRRSIRLKGYDYSTEGSYFVTLVVRNREQALGDIQKGKMRLSGVGSIVNQCWLELPEAFPDISLDIYQIMPDHFHGIVVLWENHCGDLINQIATTNQMATNQIPTGLDAARFGPVVHWQLMKNSRQTLGKIVRHFKAKAAKRIHDAGFTGFQWQSRFHDRIIRDPDELARIRNYIRNNPLNWRDGNSSQQKAK